MSAVGRPTALLLAEVGAGAIGAGVVVVVEDTTGWMFIPSGIFVPRRIRRSVALSEGKIGTGGGGGRLGVGRTVLGVVLDGAGALALGRGVG